MKIRTSHLRLALALSLVTGALSAHATVTLYNDRIDWLAAVSGDMVFTEKFDAEHPDLSSGVDFSGFNLKTLGRYLVGETHLGGLHEYLDGDTGDALLVTPVANAHGFGGDFGNFTGGGEGASVLLSFVGGGTASFDIQSVIGGGGGLAERFFGFVSTVPVSSIGIVATNPDGNEGNGESFSADNFHIAAPCDAVPEPASMAALGLGALGILKRRKKA